MNRLDEFSNKRLAAQQGDKPGGVVLEMPHRKDIYQAFGSPTSDPQIRVIIYAKQMFVMPRYDVLYDVVFSGLYDFVGLVYPHQRIRIYGRNLSDLVFRLRINSVEWIREYAEGFHELPDDDGTLPVITEIQIEGAAMNPFE
jgi:hypothetical protein